MVATPTLANDPVKAAQMVLAVMGQSGNAAQQAELTALFGRHPSVQNDYEYQNLARDLQQFFAVHLPASLKRDSREYKSLSDTLIEAAVSASGSSLQQIEANDIRLSLIDRAQDRFVEISKSELERLGVTFTQNEETMLREAFVDALNSDEPGVVLQDTLNVIAHPNPNPTPYSLQVKGLDLIDSIPAPPDFSAVAREIAAPSAAPQAAMSSEQMLQRMLARAQKVIEQTRPKLAVYQQAAQKLLGEAYDKGKSSWESLSQQARQKIIGGAIVASMVAGSMGKAPQKTVSPLPVIDRVETTVQPSSPAEEIYEPSAAPVEKEISPVAEEKWTAKPGIKERAPKTTEAVQAPVAPKVEPRKPVAEPAVLAPKEPQAVTSTTLPKDYPILQVDVSLRPDKVKTLEKSLKAAEKLSQKYEVGNTHDKHTRKFYEVMADFVESSEGFMAKRTQVGNTKEFDIGFGHNMSLKNQKQLFNEIFGDDAVYNRVMKGGKISRKEAYAIFDHDIASFDKRMRQQLNAHEAGLYEKLPMNTRVGLLSAYYNLSLLVVNDEMLAALSQGAKSGNYEEAGHLLANSTYHYQNNKFHINHGYGQNLSAEELKEVAAAWKKHPGHLARRALEASMVAGKELESRGMSAASIIMQAMQKQQAAVDAGNTHITDKMMEVASNKKLEIKGGWVQRTAEQPASGGRSTAK